MSYQKRWVANARADADSLGLSYGDVHPTSGLIWGGAQYHSVRAFENLRRRNLLNMAKHRCKKSGRELALTTSDIDDLWPEDGRCPVFPSIVFEWGNYKSGSSPSIDRIDNSKGYTKENCRIISWRANRLKSDTTPEELELLAADARRLHNYA